MDRRFIDRFSVTRARLLDDARERYPFRSDLADTPVLTRAEVDRLGSAGPWVTRSGPSSYRFDWSVAERALSRPLSPFEQRILRETIAEEGEALTGLVDGLDALLAS